MKDKIKVDGVIDRKKTSSFKRPKLYLLALILPFTAVDSFCGECRARSACTYVQSDLALHPPLLYHYCLLTKIHPFLLNQVASVCLVFNNLAAFLLDYKENYN